MNLIFFLFRFVLFLHLDSLYILVKVYFIFSGLKQSTCLLITTTSQIKKMHELKKKKEKKL